MAQALPIRFQEHLQVSIEGENYVEWHEWYVYSMTSIEVFLQASVWMLAFNDTSVHTYISYLYA